MHSKKNTMGQIELSKLIEMKDPRKVLNEVKIIISKEFPEFNFVPLYKVFYDIVRLFEGKYPGYQKCNTNYHDLYHTTDTVLALTSAVSSSKCNTGESI